MSTPSQYFSSPDEAEQAFYEAFERADLEAMMAVWADEDDVICIHPGGPRLLGLAAVRASWRSIFFEGPRLSARMAATRVMQGATLSVHSTEEHLSLADDPQTRQIALATNVYLRGKNGWRMVMHHASPLPESTEQDEPEEAPRTLH
ncbi:MAG: nuclear transport factor 2 family protein [Rhodocyclaceae bacterium]|nr:nuclear transport factor 2 family protein [Rhodocyclaceae bacterium]MBX3671290.1 nuclear transport factor 2 family protein [Rhodocyclaceae bacterium]